MAQKIEYVDEYHETVTKLDSFGQLATEKAGQAAEGALFHAGRIPLYLVRFLGRAPVGAWHMLRRWWRWVTDKRFVVNHSAVLGGNIKGNINALEEKHSKDVLQRVYITAFVLAVLAVAGVVTWVVYEPWQWAAVVAPAAVLACAASYDAPVLSIVEARPDGGPVSMNESLIIDALRNAGGEPDAEKPIKILQPPTKIAYGWQAIVKLGYGVEAKKVISKKGAVAAVLDRDENFVHLATERNKPAGWLKITINDAPLSERDIGEWPLKNRSWNYYTQKLPIGVDASGELVEANKKHVSTVYGGVMRSGKTVSMQTSILGHLKDLRVEVHVYDLKGGADWTPLEPVLHFFRSGADKEDHEAIKGDLDNLVDRMQKRFDTLKTLPSNLASPDCNDELASLRQYDLHPIVILIDESHEMFDRGKELFGIYDQRVSKLLRRGPAVGITFEVGSQKMTKDSFPYADLCYYRMCHAVQGWRSVDQVLGDGAYAAGYKPDELDPEDCGVGYFGASKNYSQVKSFYPGGSRQVKDIVSDIFDVRLAADRLTGMAAGEIPRDTDTDSIVDRVVSVWPEGVKALQWVELLSYLHEARPDDYPHPDDPSDVVSAARKRLQEQLKSCGVVLSNKGVRSKFCPPEGRASSNRRGVSYDEIV